MTVWLLVGEEEEEEEDAQRGVNITKTIERGTIGRLLEKVTPKLDVQWYRSR